MVMTLSSDSPGQVHWHSDSNATRHSIPLEGGDCIIHSKVSLATLTSYRVGGPAEWYVGPKNPAQLRASLEWANAEGLSFTLIGGGSNLLISDSGLSGLVIGTRGLRHTYFDLERGQITAAAGEPLPRLAWKAAKLGWQGLEWAVGIPGTVGGAVVMNAGAHGGCTADILMTAEVLSRTGQLDILKPQDLDYRYRTSKLQGGDCSVLQATFQLKPGADPAHVLAQTAEQFKRRRQSQPYNLPSCGSVFRNPGPEAAGWLIEQAGLKGYQIGGAQVAQRHANFILNCGGATANDVFQLIRYVQEKVEQRWSYLLEPEVKIIGTFQPS